MSLPNIQPLQLRNMAFNDIQFTGIALTEHSAATEGQHYVSIPDSISRILTTRIGERVMRPEFGCDLYLLRDRDFDSHWRVKATRYIYEAISRWEPRVIFKRLHFNIDAVSGQHHFYLELDPAS